MAQSLLTRARRLPWPQILGACASALFLIRTLGAGWSGGFPSGFPDSASYLEVADRGPLSLQFWFGERPLMLPLLSWLLAGNVLMIVLTEMGGWQISHVGHAAGFLWGLFAGFAARSRAPRLGLLAMLLLTATLLVLPSFVAPLGWPVRIFGGGT